MTSFPVLSVIRTFLMNQVSLAKLINNNTNYQSEGQLIRASGIVDEIEKRTMEFLKILGEGT